MKLQPRAHAKFATLAFAAALLAACGGGGGDSGGTSTASGTLGTSKKGTGHVVSLDNYKNDVLNALVKSGGMPGGR